MDPEVKKDAEAMDRELEARIHRADFSGENGGLLERLWAKIQSRIYTENSSEEILEDIDLSAEELSMLSAAKGNPFAGFAAFPKDGKKPGGNGGT